MRKSSLLVLFCLITSLGFAQGYKLHSVYIYGFTRYVIWPDEFNKDDFEIVVLGETPLTEELKLLSASKKVGDRAIKITQISSPSEIKKCNILFVAAARSADLVGVISKVNNQPILIITEEAGLGAKGSHINFIMKDGKLAFELNQAATAKHNLKISNTLTGMAILI